MTTAPYGSWRSPITAPFTRRASGGAEPARSRGWRRLLARGTAIGGWQDRRRAPHPRRRNRRCLPVAVLGTDARARVWRCLLRRPRIGGVVRRTSRTSASTAMERDAAPCRSPPNRRRRRTVRYADFGLTPDGQWLIGVRETSRREEAVNDIAGVSGGGRRRAVSLWSPATTSTPRRASAPTAGSWPGWLGPPEHALGRLRALGRRPRRRLARSPTRLRRRRAARVDLPARVEPDGRAPLRLRPRPAGGTCTAATATTVEPLAPMDAEFGTPQWALRHARPTPSSPTAAIACIVEPGRIDAPRPARARRRAGSRPRPAVHRVSAAPAPQRQTRCVFVAGSPTEASRRSSGSTSPAGEREVLEPQPATQPLDPALRLGAARDRVPDRAAARPRYALYYPPDQRRLRRPGRRAAAADRR